MTLEMAMNNTTAADQVEDFNSYEERLVLAVFLLIIFVIGTIGNLMVIAAVALSRTLRTKTNAFVVNLTLADLVACLALPWWAVALLNEDEWALPGAEGICQVAGMVSFMSIGISIWNVTFIAVNRLILITKSTNIYQRVYTSTNIASMLIFAWCLSIVLVSLPTALGFGKFGFDRATHACTDITRTPTAKKYDIYQGILTAMLLITIAGCYTRIYFYIRKHFQKRKRAVDLELSSKSTTTTTTSRENRLPDPAWSRDSKVDRDMIEITKNLFTVVCILFACLIPVIIVNSVSSLPDRLHVYATSIAFSNSAINPLIYAWRHPHFKVVLRLMIKCRYWDIPQPSSLLLRGV